MDRSTRLREVVERFRAAVDTSDIPAAAELLAEDVILFSPIPRRPFEGRESVLLAFRFLSTVAGEHRFVSAMYGTDEAILCYEGVVADSQCEWVHWIAVDQDGLICRVTDMMRPLSATIALRDAARAVQED